MTRRMIMCFCFLLALPQLAGGGERLDRLLAQGFVRCGVSDNVPGFAQRLPDGQFVGFEADLCRALAAALFGSAEHARFAPLADVHEFLAQTQTDIVFHRLTWTLTREAPGQLEFGPVVFHDAASADGREPLEPLEPLAPLLHSDDSDFSRVVRWTFFALVDAEERGVRRDTVRAGDWPENTGQALGLKANWAANAVAATGNYGEIFTRNFPQRERGMNRLVRDGGVMFALPVR